MGRFYDGRGTGRPLCSIHDRIEFVEVVCNDSAVTGGLAICMEDSVAARERLELRCEEWEMQIATIGEAVPDTSVSFGQRSSDYKTCAYQSAICSSSSLKGVSIHHPTSGHPPGYIP